MTKPIINSEATPLILSKYSANIMEPVDNLDYIPNQITVKFKPDLTIEDKKSIMDSVNGTLVSSLASIIADLPIELWLIKDITVEEAIQKIGSNPMIEYVEPNYVEESYPEPHYEGESFQVLNYGVSSYQTPNDPHLNKNWGINKIKATDAWGIATSNTDLIVAVIDSGVDYTHEDLKDNIWINKNEIPNNGIDDDKNGFIDDYRGGDFSNAFPDPHDSTIVHNFKSDPMDFRGHGTHVAGIIGAVGNNNKGSAGVNWNIKIMPLKTTFGKGRKSGKYSIFLAIAYAYKNGAKIINISAGSPFKTDGLEDIIKLGIKRGVLFVCASGNDHSTVDYPAAYDLDNVISVTATTQNDHIYETSSYDKDKVDLAAPGQSIYSTWLENSYVKKTGTSMAAPFVAGAASLLLAKDPFLTVAEIKELLMDSVDESQSLKDKVKSKGRLNIYEALSMIPTVEDNIVITKTTPKQKRYRAKKKITAGGGFTVLSNESVTFNAGQSIDFEPNFDVNRGASFDAVVE